MGGRFFHFSNTLLTRCLICTHHFLMTSILRSQRKKYSRSSLYASFGSLQTRNQQCSIRLMSKFAGKSMCRSICYSIIKLEICSYLALDVISSFIYTQAVFISYCGSLPSMLLNLLRILFKSHHSNSKMLCLVQTTIIQQLHTRSYGGTHGPSVGPHLGTG